MLTIARKRASDNQAREQAKNQPLLTTHPKKNVEFYSSQSDPWKFLK